MERFVTLSCEMETIRHIAVVYEKEPISFDLIQVHISGFTGILHIAGQPALLLKVAGASPIAPPKYPAADLDPDQPKSDRLGYSQLLSKSIKTSNR